MVASFNSRKSAMSLHDPSVFRTTNTGIPQISGTAFFNNSKVNLSFDFGFHSIDLIKWDRTWLFNVMSLGSKIQVNVTFAIGVDSKLFIFKTFKEALVRLEHF